MTGAATLAQPQDAEPGGLSRKTRVVLGFAAIGIALTVYARIGDGFAWACAIIAAVLLVLPGYALPPPTPPG